MTQTMSHRIALTALAIISVAHIASAGITRSATTEHLAAAKSAAGGTVQANGTERAGYPAYYYHPGAAGAEVDRDPRQWMTGYGYGSPMGSFGLGGFGGGSEMLLTCLLVVLGIGVIGLPFLLLIFSAFTGGQGGVNFIPPTTTTTVAGRKRRDVLNDIFPDVHPLNKEKVFETFMQFIAADDKMEYIKKLIDG